MITSPYISDLSALLKFSSSKIRLNIDSSDNEIPDKDEVLELIKYDYQKTEIDIISRLVDISITRINHICLSRYDEESLFWDLINRILNAKIGSLVKTYRSKKLTRNNDVNFRTSFAVKSGEIHQ